MPYFFVEGHCEQKFLGATCGAWPVRRINLNGSAVSIEQIVIRIESIFRTMGSCSDPVIVIFDREKREESSKDIAAKAVELLAQRNIKAIVGVPDRCIETWMLYDPEVVPISGDDHEGSMGASAVRHALGTYNKANDGPRLLKSCRASELLRSPSFKALADALHWLDCWWLQR